MAKWSHDSIPVQDEIRNGRPSFVANEIVHKTEEMIHAERHLTIDEQSPEVSKTVHETVKSRLGYLKLCVRWVLKMLSEDHKQNRVANACLLYTSRCV